MAIFVTSEMPGLVSVTVSGALVVPTVCAGKVKLVGEEPSSGWVPVPVNVIVSGVSGVVLPLSVRLIVATAVRGPGAAGVNVTVIVQLAFAANVVPQLLVWVKSPGLAPEKAIGPVKFNAVALWLVRVTDW